MVLARAFVGASAAPLSRLPVSTAPTPTPPAPAEPPRRILIIRPSALGDVCRSVPVLAALRAAFPAAEIDWLVQDAYAPAIEHHPALTRAVPFPRKRFGSLLRRARFGEVLDWLGSLRRARYDLVLDCQGLFRSGAFAWFTRAPRRVGFDDARELGWLGLSERVAAPRSMHTVDRMLALARAVGADAASPPDMRLYAAPDAHARVHADPLLAQKRSVLLAPTSRWAGKRWPADRFAQAARVLLDTGRADVIVLVGGPSERDQVAPLLGLARAEPRVIDRVGATSVADLMALVEASALVVANDSAPLHMAVGFDRPCVALFGPTRTDLVGPWRRERDVIQHVSPGERLDHKNDAAGRALMERITVDEVVAAAAAKLGGAADSAPAAGTPRHGTLSA